MFDLADRVQRETFNHDAGYGVHMIEHNCGDGFGEGWRFRRCAFQFDIKRAAAWGARGQDARKGGHAFAPVLRASMSWKATVEPRADIRCAEFVGGQGGDGNGASAGAFQRGIVDNDGHAVARAAHVELKPIRAVVKGAGESRQRVLRRERRRSAMADDQGARHEGVVYAQAPPTPTPTSTPTARGALAYTR